MLASALELLNSPQLVDLAFFSLTLSLVQFEPLIQDSGIEPFWWMRYEVSRCETMTTISCFSCFSLFFINKLLGIDYPRLSVQFQMNHREQSIQLVATDSHNRFYLTQQAKELLNGLDAPLSLVSIAGMYRTGKSYLVNRLLRNKHNGFKTGSTTQSVTKGLNIWSRPITAQHEHGQEMMYLVVDSEGIGSCEQESKYDTKLLMLLFLISSTVVYNSMGAIDQNTLDQLRVVLNLQQCLGSSVQVHKPKLVWVLRDFALQLIDKHGHDISPDEYLENCLEEAPATSLQVRKKNQIRQGIKQGVGKRKCFTLVRPTISEQDLADLNKCKIRSEFISQIESIREEVFGGVSEDVKRIGGRPLTGKLMIGILEECLTVMNGDQIPQLSSIWQSVREIADQQNYEGLCQEMKKQLQGLHLPMAVQDLKSRLNETQNKFYNRLSDLYEEADSFKKYNRQFLRFTFKLNREIKSKNSGLNRERVLRQIKQFVRENIVVETIEPTNLAGIKALIDRMELRVKKEPEGYEYLLGVLCDLMRVCEQKAQRLQMQYFEMQKLLQVGSLQRKNADISLISVKQEYNQSLKTICNLKVTQEEHEKQIALLKHQNEMLQASARGHQQESQGRHAALIRQMEETSFRAKQRNEEMNGIIRDLRKQNSELESEVQELKHAKLTEGINERKQVIFQEKIKQHWDRFEEERTFLRKQMNRFRKESEQYRMKLENERKETQKIKEESSQIRDQKSQLENNFKAQMESLNAIHAQTKKTYMEQIDAIHGSSKILKNIENLTASGIKSSQKKAERQTEDRDAIRKHYENQIERLNRYHKEEAEELGHELQRLKSVVNDQQSRLELQQGSLKCCLQEKQRLQHQLMSQTERFNDTVSEIEHAKQKQRSMYEQSIIRLLGNLDQRQYLKRR